MYAQLFREKNLRHGQTVMESTPTSDATRDRIIWLYWHLCCQVRMTRAVATPSTVNVFCLMICLSFLLVKFPRGRNKVKFYWAVKKRWDRLTSWQFQHVYCNFTGNFRDIQPCNEDPCIHIDKAILTSHRCSGIPCGGHPWRQSSACCVKKVTPPQKTMRGMKVEHRWEKMTHMRQSCLAINAIRTQDKLEIIAVSSKKASRPEY